MAHFINDHCLLYVDHYRSDSGIGPSEQPLYLLDLTHPHSAANDNKHAKDSRTCVLFGNREQYVTSGRNLIAFACGPYTKYAPTHLVKARGDVDMKNHLWVYRVNSDLSATLIGHNYSLDVRIKSEWRRLHPHSEASQIISREFDGLNKDRYWLIVCTERQVLIFDVPSLILTWSIPLTRFMLRISNRCTFNYSAAYRPYVCSQGVVLKRTALRSYVWNKYREEADFALHAVPFWSHEQMTRLLQPYVDYVDDVIYIILSYLTDPMLDECGEVSSHLRYIQGNCLAVSDGFSKFVVFASYWNKQQRMQIEHTLRRNKVADQDAQQRQLGVGDLKENAERNQSCSSIIFKVSWDQLMEYQQEPTVREDNRGPDLFKSATEKGSYFAFCESII